MFQNRKREISVVLAWLVSSVIVLGSIGTVVAANPTVHNPGFEDDGVTPIFWTFYSTTDPTSDFVGFYSPVFAHSGLRSVGIDIVDPEDPSDEGIWYQGGVQPVDGDVDYNLSAWVFVAGASPNAYVKIGVRWYDSVGRTLDEAWSADIGGGIAGWIPLSMTGLAPIATASAEIRLKLWVGDHTAYGEIYIDDIELTVNSSAAMEKPSTSPPDHGWYLDPDGDPYNEMLQITITATGEPVNVTSFTLQAGGTANDATDVAEVQLIWDSNSNGTYDLGDEILATGTYASDNGSLTIQNSHIIPRGESHSFIFAYQLAGTSDAGETFRFNLTAIGANGQTSNNPIIIKGLPLSSSVKTTVGSLIATKGPEAPEDHYWNSTGEPDPYNEMLQLKLEAWAEDFTVSAITLQATGTGNDSADITEVHLIVDHNGNGHFDHGERFASNGSYPTDDGGLTLSIDGGYVISKWNSVYFLIVYQMADSIVPGKNFTVTITALTAMGSMDESQFVVGLPIRSSIKTAKDTTIPYIGPPTQDPDLATVMPTQAVTVSVNVTDKGSGVGDVILSYRTHSGLNGLPPWALWTDVSMSKGLEDRYVAEIAGMPAGATVEYKIIAFDTDGNMAVEDNAGQYYVYTVTQEVPFWMQWWFVLIVGIVIVASGGIVLFLKLR